MTNPRPMAAALAISLLAAAGPSLRAAEAPPEFDRLVELAGCQGRLETRIATYRGPGGAEVVLIAAFHVGDPRYYAELQGVLDRQEVLLYEGWRPESPGHAPPPPPPSIGSRWTAGMALILDRHLGRLQSRLFQELGLLDQWKAIDYGRPSFVNADMDWSTFLRRLVESDEAGSAFRAAFDVLLAYAEEMPFRLLHEEWPGAREASSLICSVTERRRILKFLLIREAYRAQGAPLQSYLERMTVTIHERNELVLESLRDQLRAGKRRIGVFYGAAHMPGLSVALTSRLGFQEVREEWITAWDMTRAAARR